MTGTIRHGTKKLVDVLMSTDELTTAGSMAAQVAIVTGGGDGIGYEAAPTLMGLGAAVTIAELDEDSGTSAARRLQAGRPGSHVRHREDDGRQADWHHQVRVIGARAVDPGIHGPLPPATSSACSCSTSACQLPIRAST